MTKFNSQFNNETIQLLAGHNQNLTGSSQGSQNFMVSNSLPMFSELEHEVKTFTDGETIYKEGEAPKALYILKSGCVKIYIHREASRGRTTTPEYVTKLVSPNEVFGYNAILSEASTTSYAKVVKTATVWVYSAQKIMSLLSQVNPLLKTIMQQSARDLQSYENINQFHYLASVQERIAYQIISLADRFGTKTAQGISLNLKLTRNELAQLASTINESLSRHLTEFKNEGLIDINGKEIIILNREALAAKSGNF